MNLTKEQIQELRNALIVNNYYEGRIDALCDMAEAHRQACEQEPVAWCSRLGEYAHIEWGKKPDDNVHDIPVYAAPVPAKLPEDEK